MVSLRSILKKLRGKELNQNGNRAKCFSEDLNYNGPFDYIDQGVYRVPLNQIVGSIGKCSAFDNKFMIKAHVPTDRLINIKQVMRNGKLLPPLNLYKVNDEYYVMDGNHRVAAAKELGHSEIIAKVVELIPSNNICCISNESG